MEELQTDQSNSCHGECAECPSHSGHSHDMPTEQVPGGLVGGQLAAAAAVAFLFPVGLAAAGAILAGGGANRRFVGAVIGLVLGVVIAATATKLASKRIMGETGTGKKREPGTGNPLGADREKQ